jgi:hypothetical protein
MSPLSPAPAFQTTSTRSAIDLVGLDLVVGLAGESRDVPVAARTAEDAASLAAVGPVVQHDLAGFQTRSVGVPLHGRDDVAGAGRQVLAGLAERAFAIFDDILVQLAIVELDVPGRGEGNGGEDECGELHGLLDLKIGTVR